MLIRDEFKIRWLSSLKYKFSVLIRIHPDSALLETTALFSGKGKLNQTEIIWKQVNGTHFTYLYNWRNQSYFR